MNKSTKRLFSLATLFKLFLVTSITAGNPVSTTKIGDGKVKIEFLSNDSFKQSGNVKPQTLMYFIPKETILKTNNDDLMIK